MTSLSFIPLQTTSRYDFLLRCFVFPTARHLKKTGDMAVGQVSFHNDKRVCRTAFAK